MERLSLLDLLKPDPPSGSEEEPSAEWFRSVSSRPEPGSNARGALPPRASPRRQTEPEVLQAAGVSEVLFEGSPWNSLRGPCESTLRCSDSMKSRGGGSLALLQSQENFR
ncbi:unnamed protein product [Gadus morhua 'NCC']